MLFAAPFQIMNLPDDTIAKILALAGKLLSCADKGDLKRTDDGCGVLYGIVRDCAYKIIIAAEKEKKDHQNRGIRPV